MSDMFNVQEPLDVQDLSDVKEEKNLTPVTKNLKVRVAKAGLMSNENKEQNKVANIKSLKLELRIVDGIATVDTESGETIMKYVNKPLFTGNTWLGCLSFVRRWNFHLQGLRLQTSFLLS